MHFSFFCRSSFLIPLIFFSFMLHSSSHFSLRSFTPEIHFYPTLFSVSMGYYALITKPSAFGKSMWYRGCFFGQSIFIFVFASLYMYHCKNSTWSYSASLVRVLICFCKMRIKGNGKSTLFLFSCLFVPLSCKLYGKDSFCICNFKNQIT